MAQHPARVRLPGSGIALHFGEVFAHGCRMRAILAIDRAFAPRSIFVFAKLQPIELRMLVDNPRPAVDAHNRYYAAAFLWEGVELARERIELVLVGDDQQRHHLLVAHFALETGGLERAENLP